MYLILTDAPGLRAEQMPKDLPTLSLSNFVFQNRSRIGLALTLVVIENVAWIAEPTVFGDVLDAYIDKGLAWSSAGFVAPLSLWIGLFLTNSGVGALRRVIDPRIYLRIYSRMAVEVAKVGISRNQSTSRTAARAELIREYVTFLQYRLPEILEQSIAIIGAIVALAFADIRIALACLLSIIPLGFLTWSAGTRIERLMRSLHDTREEAFDVFASKDIAHVESYYQEITRNETTIARWTGFSFGVARVFLLAVFLVVLYISIDIDDFSTGSVFSIVAYLWTFIGSTEYLPELMESWTSLRELNTRLGSHSS